MSTVMTAPQSSSAASNSEALPPAHAAMLEDKVPERLKASALTAGFVLGLGLLFVVLSVRPLWHTDLWGHLSYGRWMVKARSVPVTEPLMPLAVGTPFVDTAWLSQLIGYLAMNRLGPTSLSFFHALSITLMVGLLAWRGYDRSKSVGIALAGAILWLWGCWQHLTIIRPQTAGMLCFVILLAMLDARRHHRWYWIAIPTLFAAWGNLHGSWIVGLVFLAALAAGRAIDVAVRCGEFRAVQRDRRVRRFVLLLELCAAAVLLNPYGVRLYAEVLMVASNPNVADLVEWGPLQFRQSQGQVMGLIAAILIVLYRLSPRRVSASEALLLFGFGAATLWTSRMVVWWTSLAVLLGMRHASAIWHARWAPLEQWTPPVRNGRWSVICVGLIWICFAFTPFGGRLLHGETGKLKFEKMVSRQTPLGVVEHLKKLANQNRLPRGQMFNTYEWGDYLLWAGPSQLKVFVASHVHLVPREVWQDYLSISHASEGWEELLDRYGVNLITLDEQTHGGLIRKLRENPNWRLSYSDQVGAVFIRRKPV